MNIGILGTGTWGTALGRMLSNARHDVTMWSAIPAEIEALSAGRRHRNLPGMVVPERIAFTADISEACRGREILVFAVPSVFVRSTAERAAPHIPDGQIVVDVAKGIEPGTLFTMTQVLRDALCADGNHGNVRCVALSGPTHAEEVAQDMLTTIVAACEDDDTARQVQRAFSTEHMRVYTNVDVLGVELAGALKNIVALASGVAKGLGYGDNARAALITRGAAEIARLGVEMGCLEQTFGGLAGVGDLIVTCTSEHSRNNRCGFYIGRGMAPERAVEAVGMVVEGLNALPAALQLAEKYGVELPIAEAVQSVVSGRTCAREAVMRLMRREEKSELSRSALELCFERAAVRKERGMGMKRVITYGTFDLLHYGHINLLRRAKALGDYLIVVISTDEFNWNEKHKRCYFTYEQRKALVEAVRYVDLVIPEESWQQKRSDMHEYHVDTFVMGDDWAGKFDFLKEEGVEVVYLPRTPEISSSQMKRDLSGDEAGESRVTHDDIDTDPGR